MSRPKSPRSSVSNSTQPSPVEQQYFRVDEAAAYLRSTSWLVAQACRDKQLPYFLMGKRFVISRTDLDEFAARLRVSA
jgi:excisionase family DNA binding protein